MNTETLRIHLSARRERLRLYLLGVRYRAIDRLYRSVECLCIAAGWCWTVLGVVVAIGACIGSVVLLWWLHGADV